MRRSLDVVLGYARRTRWEGRPPTVGVLTGESADGVRVSKAQMEPIEARLERSKSLPRYDILIRPRTPTGAVGSTHRTPDATGRRVGRRDPPAAGRSGRAAFPPQAIEFPTRHADRTRRTSTPIPWTLTDQMMISPPRESSHAGARFRPTRRECVRLPWTRPPQVAPSRGCGMSTLFVALIPFRCQSCQQDLRVSAVCAGTLIRCPVCQALARVPGPPPPQPVVLPDTPTTPMHRRGKPGGV